MRRDIIRDMEMEADRQLRHQPGRLRYGFVYTDAFAVIVAVAVIVVIGGVAAAIFW